MSSTPENENHSDLKNPTDQTRRRLTSAGIAGAGVILSVASRSAMGGWGQCTGSELASGNLSRDMNEANPCGCSPGYWWNNNGTKTWNEAETLASYRRTQKFNTVFGVTYFKDSKNVTLGECKEPSSDEYAFSCSGENMNSMKNVSMHAVAALLNASFYGTRYPLYTTLGGPTGIITHFQNAFASPDRCNALKAFVTQVDIYGKWPNLWCAGNPE